MLVVVEVLPDGVVQQGQDDGEAAKAQQHEQGRLVLLQHCGDAATNTHCDYLFIYLFILIIYLFIYYDYLFLIYLFMIIYLFIYLFIYYDYLFIIYLL